MKHFILVFVSFLFCQGLLSGKIHTAPQLSGNIQKQDTISDTLKATPKFGPGYRFNLNPDIPYLPNIDRKYFPGNQGFSRRLPPINDFDDNGSNEYYPGSSRFYGKRPYLNNTPGTGNFNIKPDAMKLIQSLTEPA